MDHGIEAMQQSVSNGVIRLSDMPPYTDPRQVNIFLCGNLSHLKNKIRVRLALKYAARNQCESISAKSAASTSYQRADLEKRTNGYTDLISESTAHTIGSIDANFSRILIPPHQTRPLAQRLIREIATEDPPLSSAVSLNPPKMHVSKMQIMKKSTKSLLLEFPTTPCSQRPSAVNIMQLHSRPRNNEQKISSSTKSEESIITNDRQYGHRRAVSGVSTSSNLAGASCGTRATSFSEDNSPTLLHSMDDESAKRDRATNGKVSSTQPGPAMSPSFASIPGLDTVEPNQGSGMATPLYINTLRPLDTPSKVRNNNLLAQSSERLAEFSLPLSPPSSPTEETLTPDVERKQPSDNSHARVPSFARSTVASRSKARVIREITLAAEPRRAANNPFRMTELPDEMAPSPALLAEINELYGVPRLVRKKTQVKRPPSEFVKACE